MSTQTKYVVVGTALQESNDAMIRSAAAIAHTLGARLHLVHAFEVPPLYPGAPCAPVAYTVPPDAGELRRRLQPDMDEQLRRLALGAGEPVAGEIVEGPAHRALAATAVRLGADLVVVGATDNLAAVALGSTAGRVIRSSPCPVLVYRRPLQLPPRKVLLPVDFSPVSAESVETGLALLAQLAGDGGGAGASGEGRATLSIEAFTVVAPAGYQPYAPLFDLAAAQAAARDKLEDFMSSHRRAAWHVGCTAVVGGPAEEIRLAARAGHPDLVIVGTHGRSGFDRLLLGSVAESVVRSCGTSVLVVPPHAARCRPGLTEAAA